MVAPGSGAWPMPLSLSCPWHAAATLGAAPPALCPWGRTRWQRRYFPGVPFCPLYTEPRCGRESVLQPPPYMVSWLENIQQNEICKNISPLQRALPCTMDPDGASLSCPSVESFGPQYCWRGRREGNSVRGCHHWGAGRRRSRVSVGAKIALNDAICLPGARRVRAACSCVVTKHKME